MTTTPEREALAAECKMQADEYAASRQRSNIYSDVAQAERDKLHAAIDALSASPAAGGVQALTIDRAPVVGEMNDADRYAAATAFRSATGFAIDWSNTSDRGWAEGYVCAMLAATPPAAPAPQALTNAARDVLAERQRQISVEGWTPEHDDEHDSGEMAIAAAFYAMAYRSYEDGRVRWPWDNKWCKPKSQRHNLVRAGALILAEIERLDRAALTSQEGAAK